MDPRVTEHEPPHIEALPHANASANADENVEVEATTPLTPPEAPAVFGDQTSVSAQQLLHDDNASTDGSTTLEVDSGWDTDSALGSEGQISSTVSVRSSLYDYIEENGRRYHRFKAGTYMLPNDETEQERLDLQHHLFLLSLKGRLYLAPIDNIPLHNVLDLATGTGIWATDFASAFPSANVVGTDLSPIQPLYVPPNCRFEIDDAEDQWAFNYPFDYIHGRALATCFKDHVPVFRSAFNALRPGGYFEMQDVVIPFRSIDDSMKGTSFERWLRLVKEAAHALGRDFGKVPNYKSYFEEVGFVDVVEKQLAWPIGSWARDQRMKMLGAWTKEDVLAGLHGWSAAVLTRGLGMSSQEVEILLMEVRNDINSNWLHAYIPIFIIHGRKPTPIGTSEPASQTNNVEQDAS